MRDALNRLAKRSQLFCVAYFLMENTRAKRRFAAGQHDSEQGATHRGLDAAASLGYIRRVLNDYSTFGGIDEERLRDATVLELGPGDNLGVALCLLARGARRVVCLDRFYSRRDPAQQLQVYRALLDSLEDGEQRRRFDAVVDLGGGQPVFDVERLNYVHGIGIEDAEAALPGERFDIIISYAVLAHLYDPDTGMAVMDRLLVPGGRMAHKIDLSDHGMFSRGGHNPLTFLTFGDAIYGAMSSHTGRPNRRLINYYRAQLAARGFDATYAYTKTVGLKDNITPYSRQLRPGQDYDDAQVALVERIRSRLAPPYRDLPLEDLLVAGVFINATKPRS